MTDWLSALARRRAGGERAMLVTVVAARGSVPRRPGTRMVVTAAAVDGTIGGGRLEFEAIGAARGALEAAGAPAFDLRRLSVDANPGDDCAGAVDVLFQPVDPGAAWVDALAARRREGEPAVVAAPAGRGGAGPLVVSAREAWGTLGDAALDAAVVGEARALLAGGGPARLARVGAAGAADATPVFLDPIADDRFDVVLFGAGHVGRALVEVLGRLPCRVTWVDERAAEFPRVLPDNARAIVSAAPQAQVAAAPPGAYFLVMTHSHAIDEALAEAILRRGEFAYFGLIGSASKRRQFEARMRGRGVPAERFAAMTCPIGVPGIKGRDPATIAIAVAAELLQVRGRVAGGAPASGEEARA